MSRTVLFTASTFSHIKQFHLPYLRAFHAQGWQVHVACGGAVIELPEADAVFPLPFEKSITAPANLRAARQLRRLLRGGQYDLVTTHTSLAAFFTRLALKGMRRRPPLVNVVHGYLFDDNTPFLKRQVLLSAEKLTAGQTDLLLTMNRWDEAAAKAHRLGGRIAFIDGMGVDFSQMRTPSTDEALQLRQSLGFGADAFLMLFAGEFSARKHQETLIRALSLLPERVGLLLPGAGALRADCMELAQKLEVANRVAFPGQVRDMPLWYAAADGAVSSSRSEGLPFNIMEAMYFGLPVAATAVKGHTDLIADKTTGLLFPFGDPRRCADGIRTLLDDPALGRQMAEQARANVAARYGLAQVLPQVMAHYLSVVG